MDALKKARFANAAYEAYGNFAHWKNYQGLPMPHFDQLPEPIQGAWGAAAERLFELATEEEPVRC